MASDQRSTGVDMAAEEEQAPPVAAGHKRRSSPTDLESAEAALLGIMAADFPPTPAAGAVQGSGQLGPPARPQQPQQEQDGATAPIYHRTPSITAALATLLNPEAKVRGATVAVKPSIGETYSVTLWRKHATTTVGRLERHTAAVAADLKEVWKAIADAAEGDGGALDIPRTLNCPCAGYAEDAELLEQLRTIHTVEQMKLFIQAVVPQRASMRGKRAKQQPQEGQQNPLPEQAASPTAGQGWPASDEAAAMTAGAGAVPQQGEVFEPLSPRGEAAVALLLGSPAAATMPAQQLLAASGEPLTALAAQAAQAAQRKLALAVDAFAAATAGDSEAMLRPFRALLRAWPGSPYIQAAVQRWPSLSPAQRQSLFDTAVLCAHEQRWDCVEQHLAWELEDGW